MLPGHQVVAAATQQPHVRSKANSLWGSLVFYEVCDEDVSHPVGVIKHRLVGLKERFRIPLVIARLQAQQVKPWASVRCRWLPDRCRIGARQATDQSC